MIYLLAFIVLIGVIVFVHELGHYLAARSVGVTVERFSLGMPPKLIDITKKKNSTDLEIYFFKIINKKIKWDKISTISFQRNQKPSDTIFGIGLLPLGGFVKMKGILDENMDQEITGEPDELESKNPLQKIWVMSAGVIMNIVLTFVVFSSIGLIEGDMVSVSSDPIIFAVEPGGPADLAGIQSGDEILSINNIATNTWNEATSIIMQYPNDTISIQLNRNDTIVFAQASLLAAPNIKTGRVDQEIGILGVAEEMKNAPLGLLGSISYGLNQTKWSAILMLSSLKMIFTGNVSNEDVGSVIMIGDIAGQAAQAGLVPFLYIMALISMNLAFINLLPVPALDGGHIFIILLESLRRKKFTLKTRMRIQSFGMFILLGLMAYLILNDIVRYFFNG
jgi:regulator of sigma E protease